MTRRLERNFNRGQDPDPASENELRRAVEAWRKIDGGDLPIDAALLTGGRHATTVHLQTAGPSGFSVVAKLRPHGGLDLERLVHEFILPDLDVETPKFLGFVSGSKGESDVLFLEYVGAIKFRASNPWHQAAAGRWLGRCHGASAFASIPELVPRRKLNDDWVELSATRSRLAATLDNPLFGEEGRLCVLSVLELLDTAMRRWPEWEETTVSVPMVLTHGAFITRNVRVRGAGSNLTTLPFDWDHVAVRSPAVDLAWKSGRSGGFCANASLKQYRETLSDRGLQLDRDVIEVIATMGTVIRSTTCIGWLIWSLATDYVDRGLAELEIYCEALEGALNK